MFSHYIVILSFIVAAAAQVTVEVGGTGGVPIYTPSTISAVNGTVITFEFSGVPGNHSVTQSSFANPCQPLSGGFDSGWIFINSTSATPTWNLTITDDSAPIWFYCKQLHPVPHCTSGMVGAINPPTSGNTFDAFVLKAMSSSDTPGQAEGALVGIGASASAPPSPLTGAVTGFGNPTGTAASGATTESTTSSSSTVESHSSSASVSVTSGSSTPAASATALAASSSTTAPAVSTTPPAASQITTSTSTLTSISPTESNAAPSSSNTSAARSLVGSSMLAFFAALFGMIAV